MVGRICRKKKGFEPGMTGWGMMDNDSDESMEPMEEVPLKRLSE